MIEFISQYGLFFLETATIVIALMIIVGTVADAVSKNKPREKLTIKKLNDKYSCMQNMLNCATLTKKELKRLTKQEKQKAKKMEKSKKRVFVLNFKGDIKASAVDALREAITAILKVATIKDEVVVRIESGGGMITSYGLAASQLQRIRERKIPLIATIDKIAASGGYLMACVADQIYAAPFAVVGSIGVVTQLPNFNKLLKKHNVEFEQVTAGEYKRTLTMFGENTSKGRQKVQQEVDVAHKLFKSFVAENRPKLNMKKVATGEYWHGTEAMTLGLVDKLITSDDYLLATSDKNKLYEVAYTIPKKKLTKIASTIQACIENTFRKN